MLSVVAACYVGPSDVDTIGTTDASESSSGENSASGNVSASGTVSGSSTASASTTDDSATTATSDPAESSTGDSTNASEESSGGMSGCEAGPLPTPIPGCTPTPAASSGDIYRDCVDRINQFRWECQCLPPLARWNDAEACSDQQSADDQASNSAHGHFGACGEWAQNTCPNWGSTDDVIVGCLQAMWDEGPGEPFEEHGHYINMSSTEYSKVACGFSESGQGVWANQNFSP
jgi:hypothetical protein